jgi:hypothetical protein
VVTTTPTKGENTARDGSKMAQGGDRLFQALTAVRGSSKDWNKLGMSQMGPEEFLGAQRWLG